jgi:hypothetical protein
MKILLVGGNKRQQTLLEAHFHMRYFDFRHIVQKTKTSPSVPEDADLILFWSKHLAHSLQEAVLAKLGDKKVIHCYSGTDLLVAMIDATWSNEDANRTVSAVVTPEGLRFAPLKEGDVIVKCPSAIAKTKHRLDEFAQLMADKVCFDCGSEIPDTIDQCSCKEQTPPDVHNEIEEVDSEEETPTFVGGRANVPRTIPIFGPHDPESERPYAGKISIIVEIEDQSGDVVGSRQLTMEIDGSILDLPMFTRGLAGHMGEVVGSVAIQKMYAGKSDPGV